MSRRVVVVGGGYAGLTAARKLLRRGLDVTVINPHGYMTYQPLLPETAAGTVQPAHVVVPLRSALPGAHVLTGSLSGLDSAQRVAVVTAPDGTTHDLPYDDLVLAVGSVTRTFPVPGLAEHAVGFRTVEEALHLGSRALSRLEVAASTTDPVARARALTFVFVGGGYAGVEALAELDTDTVVWTAGVVANPVLRKLGLPCDPAGRVVTDEYLRVADGVWALGDCAAVPDLGTGGLCAPTAQHAVRQAARLSRNLTGRLRPYRHKDAGAVASLGLRKGVAELYGVPLRGFLAWLVHRLYHGSRIPCGRRRLLVNLVWLLGSRGRDPVALPAIESPRAPLREAHEAQAG